mmetsp:Transcript_10509/g.12374  ORF Transcript_10509/g.12374 Transcript_10509/m.12374 type:complete len:82 (+) Transcript_10509:1402-1647(+)
MVSTRVAYMSNLTKNAQNIAAGGKHGTKKRSIEKVTYANLTFQQQLIKASPEIAALDRLYKVGVEVNRFQQEEVKNCQLAN